MKGGEKMKFKALLTINQWKLFFITMLYSKNLDQFAFEYFNKQKLLNEFQIRLLKIFK
jgi:hypothetical protein